MKGIFDRFMFGVFSIARAISAIIVAICLVIAIGAGVWILLSSSEGFKTPKFSASYYQQSYGSNGAESYKNMDEKLDVEKKYGDKISNIIKKYALPAEGYNGIVNEMAGMKPKYRDAFINGLDEYLSKAQKYISKNGQANLTIVQAANDYIDMFNNAIQNAKQSEEEVTTHRIEMLGLAFSSLIIMLMFLIIPLLIQIERNTRAAEPSKELSQAVKPPPLKEST